jgi:corrinoid protein of di/trimethylamine methyltransferase
LSQKELFEKLKNSIVECDEEGAKKAATDIIRSGIDPLKAIEEVLTPSAKIVGDKFERGEFFLTNLMMAADAMKSATNTLISGITEERRKELEAHRVGTIVIATVSGDIHDIGKNIVSTLLSVGGFTVHDLGKDVESMRIIEKAIEVKADIIALSALMSTTRAGQKEVIELLKSMGKRGEFIVMVGGGSMDKAWVEEISADGWTESAGEAVKLAQDLMRRRKK